MRGQVAKLRLQNTRSFLLKPHATSSCTKNAGKTTRGRLNARSRASSVIAFDRWLAELTRHSAILRRRRLEVLVAGAPGVWYSQVAEARYPGDPARALQFCKEKLEYLARRGHLLFIPGTATLRDEPEMKEWM